VGRWIWGTGTTLNEIDGIFYAAFPKVRGRTLDSSTGNRRRIGRTIGRLHAVGAARPATNRPRVGIERSFGSARTCCCPRFHPRLARAALS